jgi:hypothetical protein
VARFRQLHPRSADTLLRQRRAVPEASNSAECWRLGPALTDPRDKARSGRFAESTQMPVVSGHILESGSIARSRALMHFSVSPDRRRACRRLLQ